MFSFNRQRDERRITTKTLEWSGTYSFPGFQSELKPEVHSAAGVYLFTFKYKDGFLIYGAGISNSIRRRLLEHKRTYLKGLYTILDVPSAEIGLRDEVWHGWSYAKSHKKEFLDNKTEILKAANTQLVAFNVFVLEEPDKRIRERIESAIMLGIYSSIEPWSDLADRGMFLKMRSNAEIPICGINYVDVKIYGLPKRLEF